MNSYEYMTRETLKEIPPGRKVKVSLSLDSIQELWLPLSEEDIKQIAHNNRTKYLQEKYLQEEFYQEKTLPPRNIETETRVLDARFLRYIKPNPMSDVYAEVLCNEKIVKVIYHRLRIDIGDNPNFEQVNKIVKRRNKSKQERKNNQNIGCKIKVSERKAIQIINTKNQILEQIRRIQKENPQLIFPENLEDYKLINLLSAFKDSYEWILAIERSNASTAAYGRSEAVRKLRMSS